MAYDGSDSTGRPQTTTGAFCSGYGPHVVARVVTTTHGHIAFRASLPAYSWPVPPSSPAKPEPVGPIECLDTMGCIAAKLDLLDIDPEPDQP